ncbi:MAG: HK97 gp10 family phage protein [Planctomycetota bacterium]|jgi:hypothetical protein
MGVSWTGDEELAAFLKAVPDKALKSMGKALYLEGEQVMRASKKIVPVDQGILRGSGHVRQPDTKGDKVTVTLGYGGPAAAYALYQHEMDLNHPGQGQKKYLEQPAKEARRGLGGRVAARLKQDLK